ncbi:AAD14_2 [Sanghuangporus sanghuang]
MDYGKTPFVIYQGAWNVMERSFERKIIPMARSLRFALAPWNVLAAGRLHSDAEEEKRPASGEKGRSIFQAEWRCNENERKMTAALEKVAKEVGTEHVTAVAIAYLMQKTPYVFPAIGGRKVEQLMANIDALKISLSNEDIKYIESILPFDLGFPLNFIINGTPERSTMLYEHAAHWDRWPLKQPIRPSPAA